MNDNRLAVLMLIMAAIFWSTSGVLIKLVALALWGITTAYKMRISIPQMKPATMGGSTE